MASKLKRKFSTTFSDVLGDAAASQPGTSLDTDSITSSAASSRRPSGQPCKLCKRQRTHPNPTPTKRRGQFLHFAHVDGSLCSSCRCFKKQCYPCQTTDQLANATQESPEHQHFYDASLVQFEEAFEQSGGGRVRNAVQRFSPPTLVKVVDSTISQGTLQLGVFWPKAVYESEEHFGKKNLTRTC